MYGTVCIGDAVNQDHPLNRGLVSRWLALPGQQRGNVFRDLMMRNHGDLTGGPLVMGARGRTGGFGSVFLDSTDDLISVPSADALQPAVISVAAWVNVTAWMGNEYSTIAGKLANTWDSGYGLAAHPEGGGKIGFWVNNYGSGGMAYAARSALAFGAWTHLLGTYDLTTIRFYLNGVEAASAAYSTAITHSVQPFRSGFISGLAPLNGYVDDLAIWLRALSASETHAWYQESRRGSPSTLNWQQRRVAFEQQAGGAATSRALYLALLGAA